MLCVSKQLINVLLALEALVRLLGIVEPACVVDGDLVTGGRRGAGATSNDLSLDTHFEFDSR